MERMGEHNFMNEYNEDLEQKRFEAIESFLELVKKESKQEKNDYRLNELIKIISNFDLSLENKEKIIDKFNLDFDNGDLKDLTPSDIAIALLDNQETQNIVPEQNEEEEDEIDFPIINYDGIILPSLDKKPDFTGEGEADLEKESQPRFRLLKKLIKDLNIDKGVYIISGIADPKMMRQNIYKAVVIPENDKIVLVCDAYGNATYISHQTLKDNSVILGLDKKELNELFFVSSFNWINDEEKWQEKISEELFEVNENKLSDIEVVENIEENRKIIEKNKEYTTEDLKQEIIKKFSTAEDWVKEKRIEKPKIKIFGLGLRAIATKFGVDGDPVGLLEDYLLLGKKIYGEDNDVIKKELEKIIEKNKEYSKEKLRQEILKQFPTAKNWSSLTQVKKREVKIFGLGLRSISNKFGVDGNPNSSNEVYLFLGKEIYGEDEIEKIEIQKKDRLKQEILKQFPTAEDWVKLKFREKIEIKIFGLGLQAIATKFGVAGNPVGLHEDQLFLGKKIYGEDNDVIKKELQKIEEKNKEHTKQEFEDEIIKKIPTVEDWIKIKKIEKPKIKIFGLGLRAIATKFGVAGNPVGLHEDYLLLGQKIYGEDSEIIKKELEKYKK